MTSVSQLVRINAPQLASATDRLLYASMPRQFPRGSCQGLPEPTVLVCRAPARPHRAWIAVVVIAVAAGLATAIVASSGPDLAVDQACETCDN